MIPLAALALALCVGTTTQDQRLEEGLARLADEDPLVREGAERELRALIREPGALRLVLGRHDQLAPEARLRVRRLVGGEPACAPALLAAMVTAEDAGQAPALLVDLLTREIARRRRREARQEGAAADPPFEDAATTGLAWPAGGSVPLHHALEWLGRAVAPSLPLALDPELNERQREPVAAAELLPAPADAVLERLLSRRGLALADFLIVRLVTSSTSARAHEEAMALARKRLRAAGGGLAEDQGSADQLEALAAAALVARLVEIETRPGSTAALFHRLALPGAADSAALAAPAAPPREAALLRLLSLGAAAPAALEPERLAALLGRAAPEEVRLLELLALENQPGSGRRAALLLLDAVDPAQVHAGCFLAGRVFAAGSPGADGALARLTQLAESAAGDGLRRAAALALAAVRPDQEAARALGRALADGVPLAAVPAVLEAARRLEQLGCELDHAELRRSEDGWCRAVELALRAGESEGAWLDAARVAREPEAVALLAPGVPLNEQAEPVGAFSAGTPGPSITRLVGVLGGRPEFEGVLAVALARTFGATVRGRDSRLWRTLAELATADSALLLMLHVLAMEDLELDRTYRAGLLQNLLRGRGDEHGIAAATRRALFAALTAERRGERIRLLRALEMPPP